ncbi:MAG TPA: hypothetical protein VEH84_14140 [Alphaproteobacteria bacterium]|nr:hypothetical protein [Alphaproteobacteria bacterium]
MGKVVTITLTADQEARLIAMAHRLGADPQALAQQIVDRAIVAGRPLSTAEFEAEERRLRPALQAMDRLVTEVGSLSDEFRSF